MMKRLITVLILGITLAITPVLGQDDPEIDLCPGRGERCAQVEKEVRLFGGKLFTIRHWLKKTKGGPGAIIKTKM